MSRRAVLLAGLAVAAVSGCLGPLPDERAGAAEVAPERWLADPPTSCPAPFATIAPVPGQNGGFTVGGEGRSFWLGVPDPAVAPGPRPLFVAFHGTGETGASFVRRARLQELVERGFVVVAPDGAGHGTVYPVWDAMRTARDADRPNLDLEYFDRLLPCIAAHLEIDRRRVWVGGHSAGGIMTNFVLQRRSEILAGGVPASGVFSLTSPREVATLSDMLVVVTWGGDGDSFSGGPNRAVQVEGFNFVEQASLASRFYARQARVQQVSCSADLGHAWLPFNDWLADLLLAHPKGSVVGPHKLELPAPPAGVTCSSTPFVTEGRFEVTCPESPTAGCQPTCQLIADCIVENATVGPALAGPLEQLGFAGPDQRECGGCVTRCAETASSPADAEVLACLSGRAATAEPGPGIEGAQPFLEALDACCAPVGATSATCTSLCAAIRSSSAARSFVPACEAIAP